MPLSNCQLRLASWQRSMRHLRSVELVGLPFEPASSGRLVCEVLPLPPAARVRLRLRAASGRSDGTKCVDALVMVVADTENVVPPALADTTIFRAPAVPCSTHPQWLIDPAALPPAAGALRGAVLVLRQVDPRGAGADGSSDGRSHVVWRRAVRFGELAHIVADDAAQLRQMLPPEGVLLLSFVDGFCAASEELTALVEAGLLERVPSVATHCVHRPAMSQEMLAAEALRAAALQVDAEAGNAQVRANIETQLDARAAHLRRRTELRAHAIALAALREAHAVARIEVDDEQRRVDALRAKLRAGRERIERSAQTEEDLACDAARARDAATAAYMTLERLQAVQCERRRELLIELSIALPVGLPVVRGATGPSASHAEPLASSGAASSDGSDGGHGCGGGGCCSTANTSSGGAGASNGGNGGSGSGDDEEVSALLGNATQLIMHAARLMGLTLRYPMRFWASRSTIDEPPASSSTPAGGGGRMGAPGGLATRNSTTFPLFTRGSEPQKLQHGLQLFCRNVQQLLLAMGETVLHPPKQIMPALHLLVQRIHSHGPPLHGMLPVDDGSSPGSCERQPPPTTPTTPATPATPTWRGLPSADLAAVPAVQSEVGSTERLTGAPMIVSPD